MGDVPKAAVMDESQFAKMIADEQRELKEQISAGRALGQRRALGLG